MNNKEPHWIFFDLDDTLWDFSFNSRMSLDFMYQHFPVISKIFNEKSAFVDTYHKNNLDLWEAFSRGEIDSDNLRWQRWQKTLFPFNPTDEEIDTCRLLDIDYLIKLAQFPNLIEGAEELMKQLVKSNLIAILSNGFRDTQYSKIENSGLWKYITRLIVSDEIGKNKPHPDLFEYAIKETGAKPPYIMVGDHPETDIIGAMKAGWHAIWFNPQNKEFKFDESYFKDNKIDPRLYLGSTGSLKETGNLINSFLGRESDPID